MILQKSIALAWQNPTQNPPGGGGSFVIESGAPANAIIIKADGKVGIGTTTPSAKLTIHNGGVYGVANGVRVTDGTKNGSIHLGSSAGSLYVNSESSDVVFLAAGVEKMRVNTAGDVGIGTASPTAKLNIAGGDVKIGDAANPRGLNILENYLSLGETENGASTILGNNIKVTDGVNETVQVSANATDGSNYLKLNYSTGISFHRIAPAAVGTQYLSTTGELMRLTTAGNLGIGTTNPFMGQLHVNKALAGGLGGDLWITNSAANTTGNSARLSFGLDNTVDAVSNAYIQALVMNSSGYLTDLAFGTYGGGALTERMRITNAGNVGIGATAPVGKLTSTQSASVSYPTPGTGVTATALHIKPSTTTAGHSSAITFGAVDSSSGDNAQAGIYVQSSSGYGTKMYFATTNAYATGAQSRMMVDSVGNIGIGTIAPSAKLSINGGLHVGGDSDPGNDNALIDGTLTVTGNANTCNLVSYTGGGGSTQCPAGFYTWSGVALTSGYMLCCKVSNPI